MSDLGIVYVLTNSKRTMSKVGMTRTGTAEDRRRDYSREHGIIWSMVAYETTTDNVAAVEAAAHARLSSHKNNTPRTREIFNVPPDHAVAVVMSVVATVAPAVTVQYRDTHAAEMRDRANNDAEFAFNKSWPGNEHMRPYTDAERKNIQDHVDALRLSAAKLDVREADARKAAREAAAESARKGAEYLERVKSSAPVRHVGPLEANGTARVVFALFLIVTTLIALAAMASHH